MDDPVGVVGDALIVRDEDDGQSVFLVEFPEDVEDFLTRIRVKITRRLVGDQDRAAIDQGAGDRDALLLTTGELGRLMVEPALQANPFPKGRWPARGIPGRRVRLPSRPAASSRFRVR